MADAKVIEFLKYLATDADARKKLSGASTDDLVKAAKEKGYDISRDDLDAVIASKRGKVSEDQLETALGKSIGWN